MSKMLFEIEQRNRLEQKGILKRFSIKCYGKQPSLEDIRAEKTEMFQKMADKRGTAEYDEWFLKYNPGLDQNGNPKKPIQEMIETTKRLSLLPKIKSLKYSQNLLDEKAKEEEYAKAEAEAETIKVPEQVQPVKEESNSLIEPSVNKNKEAPVQSMKKKRKKRTKHTKRKNVKKAYFLKRKTKNNFLY